MYYVALKMLPTSSGVIEDKALRQVLYLENFLTWGKHNARNNSNTWTGMAHNRTTIKV